MIIDDFLKSFAELKRHAASAEFTDRVNDADGVTYPHICDDIPTAVGDEIFDSLSTIMRGEIYGATTFMRRSPEGVPCPQEVHHDISMGRYSLMLYLTEHDKAGTSFQAHRRTGIGYAPELPEFTSIVAADVNNRDAWVETDFVAAVENRALIFDAAKMHRAEPIGGVGQGSSARTVLTCFFGVKYD